MVCLHTEWKILFRNSQIEVDRYYISIVCYITLYVIVIASILISNHIMIKGHETALRHRWVNKFAPPPYLHTFM